MNKYILLLFIGALNWVSAQQVPMYNHEFVNPYNYNPAFAGFQENMKAFLVRNSRNGSFDGGSINNYLSVDGGIKEGKFGVGLQAFYQTIGIMKLSGGNASYAYHMKINENQRLSFGLSAGVIDHKIDSRAINVLDVNDPYLSNIAQNRLTFNAAAGIAYQVKSTRVSFSVPQIVGNKVQFADSKNDGFYQLERHYLFNATHDFIVSKRRQLTLSPFVTLRYLPHTAFQFDVMAMLDYKKMFWIASGYKSNYAINFNIGAKLMKSFQIGYSYELVTGSIKAYHTGMNHEIMLGYNFNLDKYKEKIIALEAQNRSVEEQLRQKLAEQELLVKQMEEERLKNQAIQDSLIKVNEQNRLLAEKTKNIDDSDSSDVRESNAYQFVELDQSQSPSGYYVVTGVFSQKANADKHVGKCVEKGFDKTYMVINQKNSYYYVVVLLSDTKAAALVSLMKYRALNRNDKTWVLNYAKL